MKTNSLLNARVAEGMAAGEHAWITVHVLADGTLQQRIIRHYLQSTDLTKSRHSLHRNSDQLVTMIGIAR